jgi:transcriptional regulator with GAF, ATPase, and Fis domain
MATHGGIYSHRIYNTTGDQWELTADTQTALLRVLQEYEFERIGGAGTIRADVRVIAATNRDLESAIAAGQFRSDLFYRMNVFPVEMLPRRERRADIALLMRCFLNRYARKSRQAFYRGRQEEPGTSASVQLAR